MERNANDTFGNQNPMDTSSGASFDATTDASFSRDTSTDASGVVDRTKSAFGTAGDKLSDAGSTVRDKAGNLKSSLADALESGAERLRQSRLSGEPMVGSATTGDGVGIISDDTHRLSDMSNQVAGGMQGAADWLRDADLDGMKSGLERQVKDHPGRTLAFAVGIGYLLGKALRK